MCSSIDHLQGFFQDSDQGEGGGQICITVESNLRT